MALLVLSITPVYIFRAVVIYISANNSDRWNLQIEITFGVLKCLMILGFCVAIFWRLKIAESYQDTKLNLLKKDSLVGISKEISFVDDNILLKIQETITSESESDKYHYRINSKLQSRAV